MRSQIKEDVWIKSYCHMCLNASCGIRVHRVNGVIVGLEGDPDNPFNQGRLCPKAFGMIMSLYDPYRPTKPLIRTNPEKGIGVAPRWKEVTWEEALDLAAKKLAEIRKDDPNALLFSSNDVTMICYLHGIIPLSFGTSNSNFNDVVCGKAVHMPTYQTMGCFHQFMDYKFCNHLVLWGSNKGGAQAHLMTTAAFDVAEARRKRGIKLVVIDPVQSNIGAKANEWIPIRPGTDMAMALAWLNVLLNETGLYDVEYIKPYTNGPYLVKKDGHYLRDEATNKPMMWDPAEGKAKPFDAEFKDVALEGDYEVNGIPGRPAFQLLKDQVKPYTPEWAAPITTIPAETIRRLATEFGQAARIGSTIDIDGVKLPYRPATIQWYTGVSQHNNGYMTGIALQTICLIVGAVNVPGGTIGNSTIIDYPYLPPEKRTCWSGKDAYPTMSEEGLIIPSNFNLFGGGLLPGYPPRKPGAAGKVLGIGIDLFPVSMIACGLWIINHLHPERFNYKIPRFKAVIGRQCNDLSNNLNPEEIAKITKDQFRIACEPLIDETAEFADVFLPTPVRLERLQVGNELPGYMGGTIDAETYCLNYSQPVVPEEQIIGREFLDIWADLAERAGFLPEYNTVSNIVWDFPEEYRLEPNKKYPYREIIKRFAEGVFGYNQKTLAREGHIKWRRSVEERYPRPFMKGRSPIYYEHFITAGEELARFVKELGFEWDTSVYEPLPSWRPTAIFVDTKPGFDLIAVPLRLPVLTHFWTTHNPWLVELAEHHPWGMNIIMNAETGARHGIKDGDQIVVEAVSGYKQEGMVKLTQCIHPEVVLLSRHGGHWCSHPVAKGKGTQFHRLMPHSLTYVDNLFSEMSTCIRVKVSKQVSGRAKK